MKKHWKIVTLVGIVSLVAAAWTSVLQKPVFVSAITLEPSYVEQTVSCMGVVEADAVAVTLPINCVVQQVNVKKGDRVQKGDVLVVLDKEATRQMLFNSAELMTLAALPDKIIADRDGTIIEANISSARTLESGTPCLVMAADEDMQIRIAIRERDLRTIRKGMSVRVTGDGFNQLYYDGELVEISSTARTDEGGTIVEGVVELVDGGFDDSLRLGLTAKASIITSVTEEGYVVPYDAVLSDENGSYVYVLENGLAQRKSIAVAAQVRDGILLEDAALAQKQIIYEAELISQSGQKVELRRKDT